MKDDVVFQEDDKHRFELIARNELPPIVRSLPADVLLAAVGAALALSLDAETISTGLKTFEPQNSGYPFSV